VDEHDIMHLFGKDFHPEELMISELNLKAMEGILRKDPYIKNVQVYADMHGKIHADISQRVPVMRVINPALQEYYIDKEGKRMPLSAE
jgi:cell division protein FtsQ